MTGVTWLHLSDWHQKGKDFDRKVVLRALIKDIKERKEISADLEKIDFVIFSGDVAFGGKPEEYQTAKEEFFQPLLEACGLGPEQLFIVPGNHDMDRDKFEMLPSGLKKPLSTEKEVQEWLTDDGKRSRVLEPFQEFASFVKEYTKQEPQDYANIKKIPIDDKEIALLGINSAWMCGRNKSKNGDYGLAIVGEPQIFDVLEKISGTALKIAVLHHPFDWLAEFDRNRIEDPLKQECDFILRGHQHNPKVEITSGTSGNCVIIPAGASYDRRIAENPRYANSYNFVHLDLDTGRGAVYLRRWSDDGNRWLEDIASCRDGRCDLDLSKSKQKAPEETSAEIASIPPNQIPPPPLHFKGREQEIEDILSKFEKGAAITGLRGMGGVGKTALALVLADKLKSRFPDGQIYIEMRGTSKNPDLPPLTPEEAMSHVIRSFKRIDRLPENPVDLRNLYNSTLAGKRVLLLLDNAKSSDQVYPLLPPEGCSVLITSRIKFELFSLVEKDLDTLQPEDARDLLLAIAPRIGDRADELAELCGYLPLALRNAAGALAEKRELKVSDYEIRLRDKVARLELVRGSFSLSYDLLTPLRKKNWRRLSVFTEDFDRNAANAVLKMSPEASAEALSDLVRWSLVDYIPEAGPEGGRYKLHDLARDFAESYLTHDELIDIQQRHANHYLNVLYKADDLYLKGGKDLLEGLKLFDFEWPNIRSGQAWARNSTVSNIFGKKDILLAANLGLSYANAGVYVLDLRLHPRDRVRWLETGLVAAQKLKYRQAEENFLGNMGSAYSNMGETRKAIEFYEKALVISREIGDRRGDENAFGNLGLAYSDLGEPRKAIEFHDQALNISREIGDRRGEGIWLGSLGLDYHNLSEPRKAIEFYEEALAIAREIRDRRSEGNLLGNLGAACSDLGEPSKAIKFFEEALAIAREIGDRRGEVFHLGNLGAACSDLGEPRKAIKFFEEALAIAREIGDRRGEVFHLGNMGSAYSDLGEPRMAIEFHEQALAIACEIGDRRGEGRRLNSLGKACSDLGELRKAIDFHERSLKISREIGNRKVEGNALASLGLDYHNLGEPRKAIEFYEQAMKISCEIGHRRGEGSQLGNLGISYSDLGETRKAIEFYEQALKISREIADKGNESEIFCNLGKAYLDLKEADKAINYCMKSLDLARSIEYRKFEGEALCTLGKAFTAQDEPEKALEHGDSALKIFKEIEYTKGEAEVLFARSQVLHQLGQHEEATSCAQQALAIFQRIESPLAEKVRQQLADWGSPQEN